MSGRNRHRQRVWEAGGEEGLSGQALGFTEGVGDMAVQVDDARVSRHETPAFLRRQVDGGA
jgi:hypothetical protein